MIIKLLAMSINLIIGCMFSGKTSYLISIAKKYKLKNKKVLLINYIRDTRYSNSDKITSHDNVSIDCVPSEKNIMKLIEKENFTSSDVICINEGQFFDNLVEFCTKACDSGKEVYVCGLDGDYLKRPFGEIIYLVPHCETVKKMYAICLGCTEVTKASFTRRIAGGDDVEEIGEKEKYIPLCRRCYQAMDKKST